MPIYYGIDNNASHFEEALALNLIDINQVMMILHSADIVIVSIPVDVMLSELATNIGSCQ